VKIKDVSRLLKILLPSEAHGHLDGCSNVRELEKVVRAWKAAEEYAKAATIRAWEVGRQIAEKHQADGVVICTPQPATPPPPVDESARPLYLHRVGNNKIGVIKAIREITRVGLKEAKDLTDLVESRGPAVVGEFSGDRMKEAKRLLMDAGAVVQT